VYSDPQAERGKTTYSKDCASCHGNSLQGVAQAPPLAGPEFLQGWNGQLLSDLFEKVKTTMPADAPGRLGDKENTDLLAFLLRANGFPAGSKELEADVEAMRQLRINVQKEK
jgi:S-disulfanyl-L-cysteine oxidoreductase SoxD